MDKLEEVSEKKAKTLREHGPPSRNTEDILLNLGLPITDAKQVSR